MKLLAERFSIVAQELERKKALLGEEDDRDGTGGSEIVNVDSMSKVSFSLPCHPRLQRSPAVLCSGSTSKPPIS